MTLAASPMPTMLERAHQALGVPCRPGDTPGMIRAEIPAAELPERCAAVVEQLDGRLATMVGLDDRAASGTFRLAYVFALPGGWLSLEAAVDSAEPRFPSVTPRVPAAHWYEREVHDLLGLEPLDHPDPRRLVLHDDWPAGVHPLRKDFDPAVAVPLVPAPPHRFHHLHGEGIVEIPVGPIHAGVIEPGHFRFAAVGELVLHLETRLFYTHRGIEKLAEGQRFDRVLQLAERVCGMCAFSHAVSYSQAVESLAGVAPPPRALALRTVFLELERLYNHIGDLGNVCAGVGFAVGASQGAQMKDALQRLNERLVGNRFLRGACAVGGMRRDLDDAGRRDLELTLARVRAEFRPFVALLVATESFQERLRGTGTVSPRVARALGAVGVAARAAGLDLDARRDHPHAAYEGLRVQVAVQSGGDVRARVQVRLDEVVASFDLVRQVLAALPEGPLLTPIETLTPWQVGLGVTESPRGENLHWVRSGENGVIDRYRVRSASYPNWPVVASAVPANMVPDFPLINKSFELCYACLDR